MTPTHAAPYHPMTQRNIERYYHMEGRTLAANTEGTKTVQSITTNRSKYFLTKSISCSKRSDDIQPSCAMAGDKERILAVGARGYIGKPINPDTFISQRQEYLPPSQSGERGWVK